MDLENAIQMHEDWKLKLRAAIASQETVDVDVIGADNRCELDRWLHGDAFHQYGRLNSHTECLATHANFHREAAKVAMAINEGRFDEASTMLRYGTPFFNASMAVGAAIASLKKESGL